MNTLVASLLLLAVGATALPQAPQTSRGRVATPAAASAVVAAPAAAAAAPAAAAGSARSIAAAPAAANTAAVQAAAGTGAATANQFVWGPAYFGPGVMNPTARRPLPQLIARADEVVASNPNVRVFVDTDGTVEFTDQFGREVEVLDRFGNDALEIPGLEEQLEFQQNQAKLAQRRATLMQQLANLNSLIQRNTVGVAGQQGAAVGVAQQPQFRIAI